MLAQEGLTMPASGKNRENRASQMNETETAYAFPSEKKEPIGDAAHVRNAIARFNQVKGVTDTERAAAWKRIQAAAREFGVDMHEASWHDLAHGGKQ